MRIDGQWVFPDTSVPENGEGHGESPEDPTRGTVEENHETSEVSAPPIIQNRAPSPEPKTPEKPATAPRGCDKASPTLEEVERYFLSMEADKRVSDWRESARRFFDNFSAVDWKDKYNRRITCWENRANSWISEDEKRQKEKLKNENGRQDPNKGSDSGNRNERRSYPGTFNGYPGGTLPPEAYTDPDWFKYNGNGIPFKGKFQDFCGLKGHHRKRDT